MQPSLASQPQSTFAPRVTQALPQIRTGAAIVAATALVAACAHVSVALPFTPVPVVLSDFAVILVGFLLGPGAGFAAMALYLSEGAVGLPVFSPHGPGGVAQIVGPSGGFLCSYPLVAAVAGSALRAIRSRISLAPAAFLAGLLASLPLFVFGAGWISILLHLSPVNAFRLAVAPFLLGATVKVTAAAALITSLQRLKGNREGGEPPRI